MRLRMTLSSVISEVSGVHLMYDSQTFQSLIWIYPVILIQEMWWV